MSVLQHNKLATVTVARGRIAAATLRLMLSMLTAVLGETVTHKHADVSAETNNISYSNELLVSPVAVARARITAATL